MGGYGERNSMSYTRNRYTGKLDYSSMDDAPSNGSSYVRKNAAWAEAGASVLPQALGTTASPTFATTKLTGLSDGYIPVHTSDTVGLVNGPIKTDVDSAVSLKHSNSPDHTQGTDTTVGVQTGDVAINNATKGLILKDTQGTPHYWRITVNNLGVLIVTDLGTSLP
jgi:hypothetical protein